MVQVLPPFVKQRCEMTMSNEVKFSKYFLTLPPDVSGWSHRRPAHVERSS